MVAILLTYEVPPSNAELGNFSAYVLIIIGKVSHDRTLS